MSKSTWAGLDSPAVEVQDFTAVAGRGTSGRINGQEFMLGNHRLIHESSLCDTVLEAALLELEQQGRTVTLLVNKTRALAIFAVADTIKETSSQAIADLKALGVVPVLFTGDNAATAQSIAAIAGITGARGDMLPETKLEAIQEMQKRYGATGMTGDGINDGPALAQANIGFAMGGAGGIRHSHGVDGGIG